MTTINTKFDQTSLPKWAQKDSAVVERCKNNLAFRGEVHKATTTQYKNHLKGEAHKKGNER